MEGQFSKETSARVQDGPILGTLSSTGRFQPPQGTRESQIVVSEPKRDEFATMASE